MSADEPRIVNSNPLAQYALRPIRSMAIKAKCAECVGCTPTHLEPGFRTTIRDCQSFTCPLHVFRPYQVKSGKAEDEEQ